NGRARMRRPRGHLPPMHIIWAAPFLDNRAYGSLARRGRGLLSAGLDLRGGGRRLRARLAVHADAAVAIDGRALSHDHSRRDNVAVDHALGLEFHAVGGFDVAFDQAFDRDFTRLDRRLALRAAGDEHLALGGNGAFELA